jgi:hypothetical protein
MNSDDLSAPRRTLYVPAADDINLFPKSAYRDVGRVLVGLCVGCRTSRRLPARFVEEG